MAIALVAWAAIFVFCATASPTYNSSLQTEIVAALVYTGGDFVRFSIDKLAIRPSCNTDTDYFLASENLLAETWQALLSS